MINLPFIIATYPRSGSHFLADLLNSTKLVAIRDFLSLIDSNNENLNKYRDESGYSLVLPIFKRHYEKLRSISKYWGVFMHADQVFILDRMMSIGIDPCEIKWIWLVRRNKIAQALSNIKAIETGVYYVPKEHNLPKEDITISESDLYKYAVRSFFADQIWETFFGRYGITPYKIYYEDFIDKSRWDMTVAGILDFLGIPYNLPLNVCDSSHKQSSKKKPKPYRCIVNWLAHPSFRKYLPFDYGN